jgi:hypothetical protein
MDLFMRIFLSTSPLLTPVLLGVAIAATSFLPCPHAAAQTAQNSAAQQIQGAQVDRDFLVKFADNLKTFADNLKTSADFGKLLYDFKNLKPPPHASAETRAFFDRIRPAQAGLAGLGSAKPEGYDLLANIYELVDAIHQDMDRSSTSASMAPLSSHTLETLGTAGLAWVTSNDFLKKLVDAGKIDPQVGISKPFAKYAGVLSFGADDLVAGLARLAGNGNWQDPETVSHLLDAFNRGTWAAVGFMVSGGNREVADLFSSAAGLVGTTVRERTVGMFADAYIKLGGFDKAILDQYSQAQRVRLTLNKPAQSFEEYVNFDAKMLRAIGPTQRSAADARFGLRAPPSPRDTTPAIVISRITHDSYNEVCQSGFCVRTDLTSAQHVDIGLSRAPAVSRLTSTPLPDPCNATGSCLRPWKDPIFLPPPGPPRPPPPSVGHLDSQPPPPPPALIGPATPDLKTSADLRDLHGVSMGDGTASRTGPINEDPADRVSGSRPAGAASWSIPER